MSPPSSGDTFFLSNKNRKKNLTGNDFKDTLNISFFPTETIIGKHWKAFEMNRSNQSVRIDLGD